MFNNRVNIKNPDINNNIKITACSGGIYKSHRLSWFERFELNSDRAIRLLSRLALDDEYEREWDNFNGKNRNVLVKNKTQHVVLQMIICGELAVIAEVIKLSDYLEENPDEPTS